MNKAEFVAAVSDAAELSKADAAGAVDAVIEVIKKALKKGDTITLVGFGLHQQFHRLEGAGRAHLGRHQRNSLVDALDALNIDRQRVQKDVGQGMAGDLRQ